MFRQCLKTSRNKRDNIVAFKLLNIIYGKVVESGNYQIMIKYPIIGYFTLYNSTKKPKFNLNRFLLTSLLSYIAMPLIFLYLIIGTIIITVGYHFYDTYQYRGFEFTDDPIYETLSTYISFFLSIFGAYSLIKILCNL